MDESASKIKGFMWVIAACFLGMLFVYGVSPLAHAIPWSWETKLATVLNSSSSQQKYIDNPQAEMLLQKIVHRIYPLDAHDRDFTIDVHIIRDKHINAHTELGGKILINSGLISQAESPEEVAGILAHEIGHVQHRDILKGFITYFFSAESIKMIFSGKYTYMADVSRYLFNMNFTRSEEAAADKSALLRLQEAHVDNHGFRDFFARMAKLDASSTFLSDHPSERSRFDVAESVKNQNIKPVLTADEWRALKADCS
jgi:predicted Zn-dependent protease